VGVAKLWKRGRGKLGVMAPLVGSWVAEADSARGPVRCTRTLEPALNGTYIQMRVCWEFGQGRYEELAMIGVNGDGAVAFWSFTSDGKHSDGVLADVSNIHPEAIGFEAHMPAGLARMAYWPDGAGGFYWAVEARNQKGWKRFTEHHYTQA
jgi:hypothetical protein